LRGSLVALDSVREPLGPWWVHAIFGEHALERPLHEVLACVPRDVRWLEFDGFEGGWGSGRGWLGSLDGADAAAL
jgi:hypothetical protein